MVNKLDHREYRELVADLLSSLGVVPGDISLYEQAFVHKSVLNEKITKFRQDYERIEFLGDAVLELVMTDILFHQFPNEKEGRLTDIRSSVVCGKNLATIARKLDLGTYVLLSSGEAQAGGADNPGILADVVESLIGALYLDQGLDIARKFIETYVHPTLIDILEKKSVKDPKTALQEQTQADTGMTPVYKVIGESGLDHDKTFEVAVLVNDIQVGVGVGTSKKQAQEAAAKDALSNM